jgi:hypothetical protein
VLAIVRNLGNENNSQREQRDWQADKRCQDGQGQFT